MNGDRLTQKEKKVIAIVGSGNVAWHFLKCFDNCAVTYQVNPRTLDNFRSDTEIALICVKDDVIKSVAEKIPGFIPIVAHTSGSVPLEAVKRTGDYGVFYPLQTFTKGVALNYSHIPFFIEGDSIDTYNSLHELAALVADKIYSADSEIRKRLHLASVFACNFTNALIGISDHLLKDYCLSKECLLPLIDQTISKLNYMDADAAQTGPAARGDIHILEKHLNMLDDNPEIKAIYEAISKYILNKSKN